MSEPAPFTDPDPAPVVGDWIKCPRFATPCEVVAQDGYALWVRFTNGRHATVGIRGVAIVAPPVLTSPIPSAVAYAGALILAGVLAILRAGGVA